VNAEQVAVAVRIRREVTERATVYIDTAEFAEWAGADVTLAESDVIEEFLKSGRDDPPTFDHTEEDDELLGLEVLGLEAAP
jgi:hypothetical protein